MNALLQLAAEQKTSALGSILPLLILAPLAYVLIVPQRKQKKKQAEMLASLGVGDDVVTSGGIHGYVTFLEDNVAHVAVDTDTVIRVSKTALTRLTTTPPERDDDADTPAETADTVDTIDSAGDDAGEAPAKPSRSKR